MKRLKKDKSEIKNFLVRAVNNYTNTTKFKALIHENFPQLDQKKWWAFAKILYFSLLSFNTNQVPVRAAALTYTTLLAFIPFIIIFSLFAGKFGYLALVSRVLPELNTSFGLNLPLDQIQGLIEHAQSIDMAGLGIMGSVVIFISFLFSMENLEKALNIIWDIRKHRNWLVRLRVYIPFLFFIITIIILLSWTLIQLRTYLDLLIAGTTGHHLQQVQFGGVVAAILGLCWFFITVLYLTIPFTKVRWKSAIIGSTFSTISLGLFFYGLIQLQATLLTRYSLLYGSLAIFPLLMVLLYFSWIIILYGVALTYGHQKANL